MQENIKYRAVANSSLYHCGYRWLVVDEKYNTISKHINLKDAAAAADRLNSKQD